MVSSQTHSSKVTKPGFIYQLHAKDANGLPAYYFLQVDPLKQKALEKAIHSGDFDLAQYGKIVRSGYGQPTNEDKRVMKEEYNYDAQS